MHAGVKLGVCVPECAADGHRSCSLLLELVNLPFMQPLLQHPHNTRPLLKVPCVCIVLLQVYWGKLNTDSICILKFSPCGRFLASGSHDQHLDVYEVKVCA